MDTDKLIGVGLVIIAFTFLMGVLLVGIDGGKPASTNKHACVYQCVADMADLTILDGIAMKEVVHLCQLRIRHRECILTGSSVKEVER